MNGAIRRTYFVAFHIESDATADTRLGYFWKAITYCFHGFQWHKMPTFLIFESDFSARKITELLRPTVASEEDTVIVGLMGADTMFFIGAGVKHDLNRLVSFATQIE